MRIVEWKKQAVLDAYLCEALNRRLSVTFFSRDRNIRIESEDPILLVCMKPKSHVLWRIYNEVLDYWVPRFADECLSATFK